MKITICLNEINSSGGVIQHLHDAVADEVIALERISIKWMTTKEFSNGSLIGYQHVGRFGNWKKI